jgi:NAD(P)H-hydrate epimerase
MVLMEHAALLVAQRILAKHAGPTWIFCGPGNNGGDGYAIARHLAIAGVPVRAIPLVPPKSPDCVLMYGIAEKLGLVGQPDWQPEVVVDAVFGTGQKAPVVVPAPNFSSSALTIAVDVPTGIDADTGARVGDFFEPDHTITIGRLKPFLFGDFFKGSYELVEIGLELQAREAPEALLVTDIEPTEAQRTDNKWSRGRVGIVAGSARLAGAAALCARGALKGGAGMVTVLAPQDAHPRLYGLLPPELMLTTPEEAEKLCQNPDGFDALVVGPGLGRAFDALVQRLYKEFPRPLILDADGLRAISPAPSPYPRLLTPHVGEAGHLLQKPWQTLEQDRFKTAAALAQIAPTLFKGAHPVVASGIGPLMVMEGGVPALGMGGTGDFLAGLCGALSARRRVQDAVGMGEVAVEAVWRLFKIGKSMELGELISEHS